MDLDPGRKAEDFLNITVDKKEREAQDQVKSMRNSDTPIQGVSNGLS